MGSYVPKNSTMGFRLYVAPGYIRHERNGSFAIMSSVVSACLKSEPVSQQERVLGDRATLQLLLVFLHIKYEAWSFK
jgi:hypothetical protein